MLHQSEYAFSSTAFDQPIAEQIWRAKYQYKTQGREVDYTVDDTLRRVAVSLATAEETGIRKDVADTFFRAMQGFKLLPAGRILSGAGTVRNVTLCNTFVMRKIPDSISGILDTVKEAALTMQMGGGIGFDFSTIRPRGNVVRGLDCPAAGPLAAMDICDTVCKMLVTGMGRGAMMATMRCDHPDIEAFVDAKTDPARLRNFNVSVMVTDAFMRAVEQDAPWDLVWEGQTVCRIMASDLWEAIMRRAYDAAEPGVLFIDTINAANPLNYLEQITATNSCAEQPLPPNGTCPLTSINLARLVSAPFGPDARMDMQELRRLTGIAVRLLDNVLDTTSLALEVQRQEAIGKRRIGVGVTGVADALIMLGVRYGTPQAAKMVESWMQVIQNAAYEASARLASVRGVFPLYNAEKHMDHAAIRSLDPAVRDSISKHGLRNGLLTTVAPTGTISMFAGNVSSGIEPVFATSFRRKITRPDGSKSEELVEDYAALLFHKLFGRDTPLPDAFVTVNDLRPDEHVRMQAAAQKWVDSGISKTVNCPEDIPFAAFEDVYRQAYDAGCKGCTTYRPNDITGSVLSS